ncbi:MAG: class I SAM-dependent methyltransferase [Eubacteriales bacterium]
MQTNEVYHLEVELARLAIQNRLFKAVEGPVYERVLAEHSQGRILDVGSNNGCKSADRFAPRDDITVTRVVGLEYHQDLAQVAQAQFGNEIFSFYGCDVEDAQFPSRLAEIMQEAGVEAFDVIHLSLVLLHLKNPKALLRTLRTVLAPGGQLMVIETNDSRSMIVPDPENLCAGFVEVLAQNPFAGNRALGGELLGILEQCGYVDVEVQNEEIVSQERAGYAQQTMKRDLYDTYVSYLKEDAELAKQKEHMAQAPWVAWVDAHFHQLKALVLAEDTMVTMGLRIVNCHSDKTGMRKESL